jgi:hypothetical protein
VGTLAGVLHAIDAESGKDVWTYRAGVPILHAAAAGEGKVFVGAADGKVHAVGAEKGGAAWTFATGAAVWNAPLVHGGLVSEADGHLYAPTPERSLCWQRPRRADPRALPSTCCRQLRSERGHARPRGGAGDGSSLTSREAPA